MPAPLPECPVAGLHSEGRQTPAILLEGLVGDTFGASVDRVVPRHNLWRDGDLLRRSLSAATTHISFPLPDQFPAWPHAGRILQMVCQIGVHTVWFLPQDDHLREYQ